MVFSFSDEHKLIRNTVRKFANDKLLPLTEKMDKEDYFPLELFKELGELGLLAPTIPLEYEGGGTGFVSQGIILEELGRVSPAFSLSVGAHSNLCVDNLYRNGSKEQHEKYLAKLASGEWIGCLGMTEPNSGSDALNLRSFASPDSEDSTTNYSLSGTKTFITNAKIADFIILYAKTDQTKNRRGITAFATPLARPGLSRGEPFEKMGMRGSLTSELFFDKFPLTNADIIGQKNQGHKVMMSGLVKERTIYSALCTGIIVTVLHKALRYSKERKQFDKPISDFQLIQDKLAQMYSSFLTSKLVSYWSLSKIDDALAKNKDDKSLNLDGSTSIYYTAIQATQSALEAIQILGGYGYMKEYEVERFMRDAKLLEIGAGTTEIRKIIMSKALVNDGFNEDIFG